MKKLFAPTVKTLVAASLAAITVLTSGCATNTHEPKFPKIDNVAQSLRLNPISCRNNLYNSLNYLRGSNNVEFQNLRLAEAGLHISSLHCPQDPRINMYLGIAYYKMGNYLQALNEFKDAVQLTQMQNKDMVFMYAYTYGLLENPGAGGKFELLNELMRHAGTAKGRKIFAASVKNLDNLKAAQLRAQKAKSLNRKQLSISTAFVLDERTATERDGMNLLDNLQLQLASTASTGSVDTTNFERYEAAGLSTSGVSAVSNFAHNTTISIPTITYDVNLFNRGGELSKVLSRPTIVATYDKEATYFSGQAFLLGLQSGTAAGSYFENDIGLSLSVTPTLVDDDTVQLDVTVENNFLKNALPGGITFSNVVGTSDNKVTTTLILPFGHTAVLSALTSDNKSKTTTKVPGLGDIPVLGHLFHKKTTSNTHDNVLIFITPRAYYLSTKAHSDRVFIRQNRAFKAYLHTLNENDHMDVTAFPEYMYDFHTNEHTKALEIIDRYLSDKQMIALASSHQA